MVERMERMRVVLPKNIEDEDKRLVQEFLDQFSD